MENLWYLFCCDIHARCVYLLFREACRYLNSVISTEGCLQGVSDIRVLILTSERTPQFLKLFSITKKHYKLI
jgi:hypothetical protein